MPILSLPVRMTRLTTLATLLLIGGNRNTGKVACPPPAASYALRLGARITISLPSNPSTGYAWAWENRGKVTTIDSSGWSFRSDRPGMPGSGGCETWIFRAKARGTDTLRMVYRRKWEPGSALQTRIVGIRVH
jgi:inhibitor of cysteine peptidase